MATDEQKEASAKRRAANRERGKRRTHARTRARPVVAGARVKVTRRCLERRLFLSPGADADEIRNFEGYCLGVALQRYGQGLHACCYMGNHHHTDVVDHLATLPAFKGWLHSNIARGLNAKRGRFDRFWSGDTACDTTQPTDEESLADLVYTEVNPVAAGLVKWGHLWPGLTTYGWRFGETRTFKRPKWYFDPENPDLPETVSITRERPKIFLELDDDELFELLMRKNREAELKHQAALRAKGRRFMGLNRLAQERWNRVPTSFEERFTENPRVAASSRWLRIAQLQRNKKWEAQYAEALAAHRRGEKPLFPPGTYWMRIHFDVRVATGPP